MQLKELNGIGEKTEKIFQRAGVNTVEDLLSIFTSVVLVFGSTICIPPSCVIIYAGIIYLAMPGRLPYFITLYNNFIQQ